MKGVAADWSHLEEMRRDYLGGSTLSEVARKYNVPRRSLSERATAAGWQKEKEEIQRETAEKSRRVAAEHAERTAISVMGVADRLLGVIASGVELGTMVTSPADVRAITAALKDLSEIKGDYSPLQREKMEAQIASLKAQTKAAERENDSGGKTITVKLADGLDDLAE